MGPAWAVADTEPNDGIEQAEGPLAGGTAYSGQLGTANDVDWYFFYAASQTQLDIAVTTLALGEDSKPKMTLRDADGGHIDDVSPSEGSTEHIRYTTPSGVNRFYLVASSNEAAGAAYQLSISPAEGITSGPGSSAASSTSEPNESRAQAMGPMLGGTLYGGGFETSNDREWFYFYAAGRRALDIAVTNTGDGGCCELTASLHDAAGQHLATAYLPQEDRISHIQYSTPAGVQRLYLRIDGGLGSTYQFRIEPADAILPGPAPPSAPRVDQRASRCAQAKRSVSRQRARVRAIRRKLRRADSRRGLRVQRRSLRVAQRVLKRRKVLARGRCR